MGRRHTWFMSWPMGHHTMTHSKEHPCFATSHGCFMDDDPWISKSHRWKRLHWNLQSLENLLRIPAFHSKNPLSIDPHTVDCSSFMFLRELHTICAKQKLNTGECRLQLVISSLHGKKIPLYSWVVLNISSNHVRCRKLLKSKF